MTFLNFFRPRINRGCLYGKSQKEKIDFFSSLKKFAISDGVFFEEQYSDLLPHEKKEFSDWIIEDTKNKQRILTLLDIINKFTNEKR